jgi:hypothetical protein
MAQPNEPFQLADDLEDAEPIPLQRPPTSLSERLSNLEQHIDSRFDLLHTDIQQLRADVLPRLTAVEKPLAGKALTVGKYTVNVTAGAVLARAVARAVAQQWPQAQPVVDLLETILGPLGL